MMSRRWPLHPPSYPDESLSSWLERIAGVYEYSVDDLLAHDLGFDSMSQEELDKAPPRLLLERLAERTGISPGRLRTMTVQGWVPLLIDGLDSDPSYYGTYVCGYSVLYPISLRHVREFRDWVPWIAADRFNERKVCRLCLREGPEPYRRLSWRMAWMASCPVHGVLLEDIFVNSGRYIREAVENPNPIPAPPEILTIDNITLRAINDGSVSLPRRQVHAGVWVRLLRALIEELSVPATSTKRYVKNIARIWSSLGLSIRQGVRTAGTPFEMLAPERRFLLMRAAGSAIDMLMKGSFKKAGDDAFLFWPLPISNVDLLSTRPHGKEMQEKGGRSAYERAWTRVSDAMNELEVAMRHSLDTAMEIRNFLLGSNPTHEKIEKIDRMFREQGYLPPDDVI